jgi:hypothetical protein
MSIPDQTFSLYGYTATFSWEPATGLRIGWEPDIPNIRSPRHFRKFRTAYAAARRSFMERVATEIGGSILVMDTDGIGEVISPRAH